jgi:F-type H+-transporting ATPase subunit gamma
MAQTRTISRRIRSVKNAAQITKALEVVAASRMRRVVQAVEGARTYGTLADEIMRGIAASPEAKASPYLTTDINKPTLFIIFTSDRGQAGAYNSNIFHYCLGQFLNEKGRPQVVVFGRKGARFMLRLRDIDLRAAYEDIADVPDVNIFASLMGQIEELLTTREIGRIRVVYTTFVSPLSQKVTEFQLAPIETANQEAQTQQKTVFEFEPDVKEVLDSAIRLYIEARLMQAKIESAASEQAMRMVAMGNANRNATDLIDDLTLELNATRQAVITQEIAEITGGAAAIAQ